MINRKGIAASFRKNLQTVPRSLPGSIGVAWNFRCTVSILGRRIRPSTANLFKKRIEVLVYNATRLFSIICSNDSGLKNENVEVSSQQER